MAKPMDFLTGVVEGASETFAAERKRRQQQADAIALLRAKAQIEREHAPPAMDPRQVIDLLKGSGLQPTGMTLSGKGEPTFKFGVPRLAPGSAKNAATVKQLQSSKAQLKEIFQQAETALPAIPARIPGIPAGVEALVGGFGRRMAAASGLNEPARAFQETQVGNARQVIRGLGEVGVLTDRDVADAVKLLPASTDSTLVRQQKLTSLNRLLDAKLSVYQTTSTPTAEQDLATEDLSQLSDEELEAIAAGQ